MCCNDNYSQYYIFKPGDFRVSQIISHMSEKLIYMQILYNASWKDALTHCNDLWDTYHINKLVQNHDVAVGTVFGILSVKNLHDRIKTPDAKSFLESIHDTYQPYLTLNIHLQILQTDLHTFP